MILCEHEACLASVADRCLVMIGIMDYFAHIVVERCCIGF